MIEKDLNRYLKWWKVWFGTHHKIQTTFCKVWEIWYTKIWCNIGSEIDGKWWFIRPVVILKIVWSLIFICPLTSKTKTGDFYYKINDKNTAILSEAKCIDKKKIDKKNKSYRKYYHKRDEKSYLEITLLIAFSWTVAYYCSADPIART